MKNWIKKGIQFLIEEKKDEKEKLNEKRKELVDKIFEIELEMKRLGKKIERLEKIKGC